VITSSYEASFSRVSPLFSAFEGAMPRELSQKRELSLCVQTSAGRADGACEFVGAINSRRLG
jgi:hypothetical protein